MLPAIRRGGQAALLQNDNKESVVQDIMLGPAGKEKTNGFRFMGRKPALLSQPGAVGICETYHLFFVHIPTPHHLPAVGSTFFHRYAVASGHCEYDCRCVTVENQRSGVQHLICFRISRPLISEMPRNFNIAEERPKGLEKSVDIRK